MKNSDELIDKLINAAVVHGKALQEGKARQANKYYAIIQEVEEELKKDFSTYIKRLEPLLEHEEDYVKLWVSYYLLPILTNKAEDVLEELSTKRGAVSFDAKMTLQEWRKGNLKF